MAAGSTTYGTSMTGTSRAAVTNDPVVHRPSSAVFPRERERGEEIGRVRPGERIRAEDFSFFFT